MQYNCVLVECFKMGERVTVHDKERSDRRAIFGE
jgi:hypothetical protein